MLRKHINETRGSIVANDLLELVDNVLNNCDIFLISTQRGDTPLHLASKLGHEEIVDFLLSFPSIDTTIKNK